MPTPNNGSPELVTLVTQHVGHEVLLLSYSCHINCVLQDRLSGETQIWFMFQKIKYIYKEGQFSPLPFPVDLPFSQYTQWKGYGSDDDVDRARVKYGKNKWVNALPQWLLTCVSVKCVLASLRIVLLWLSKCVHYIHSNGRHMIIVTCHMATQMCHIVIECVTCL